MRCNIRRWKSEMCIYQGRRTAHTCLHLFEILHVPEDSTGVAPYLTTCFAEAPSTPRDYADMISPSSERQGCRPSLPPAPPQKGENAEGHGESCAVDPSLRRRSSPSEALPGKTNLQCSSECQRRVQTVFETKFVSLFVGAWFELVVGILR